MRRSKVTGVRNYKCRQCNKFVQFTLGQPLSYVANSDRQKIYRVAECSNCGWKGWTSFQK